MDVNKQIWLPPSDSDITLVLVQNDTAGHYRVIGDQVNKAPNSARGPLPRRTRKLQGSHEDSSL